MADDLLDWLMFWDSPKRQAASSGSFRSATTFDVAATNSQAVNVPAGVVDGDLLILAVCFGTTGSMNALAGWTLLAGPHGILRNSTSSIDNLNVYYRYASSEPASYTLGASANVIECGIMAAYKGVSPQTTPVKAEYDATGPFDTTAVATSAASADPNVYDESIIYVFAGRGFGALNSFALSGGATINQSLVNTNGGANRLGCAIGFQHTAAAANYPARSATLTWSGSNFNGCALIRISTLH